MAGGGSLKDELAEEHKIKSLDSRHTLRCDGNGRMHRNDVCVFEQAITATVAIWDSIYRTFHIASVHENRAHSN